MSLEPGGCDAGVMHGGLATRKGRKGGGEGCPSIHTREGGKAKRRKGRRAWRRYNGRRYT